MVLLSRVIQGSTGRNLGMEGQSINCRELEVLANVMKLKLKAGLQGDNDPAWVHWKSRYSCVT